MSRFAKNYLATAIAVAFGILFAVAFVRTPAYNPDPDCGDTYYQTGAVVLIDGVVVGSDGSLDGGCKVWGVLPKDADFEEWVVSYRKENPQLVMAEPAPRHPADITIEGTVDDS